MHKPGDIVTLTTERMSYGTAAVARMANDPTEPAAQTAGRTVQAAQHQAQTAQRPAQPTHAPADHRPLVVFVEGAAPREKVRARLTRQHKNYWEATLIEILDPSPDRVSPPCPVFGRCGGCSWQHLSYPAQIEAKKEILLHQLAKATRLPRADLEAKTTVRAASAPFGYRWRVQVHGDGKGLGFFARGSHDIAYSDRCLVAHPDIQAAWSTFLQTQDLATLASKTGQFKVEWTRTEAGMLRMDLNRKHAVTGFIQANDEQNVALRKIVADFANASPGRELLLELYGGNGNLTNELRSSFARILSVDAVNDGADASEIAPPLALGRTFVQADTKEFLTGRYWRDWIANSGTAHPIDVVVADPPRAGLEATAELIAQLDARALVLVSCDPSTLARDLAPILKHFAISRIALVDMFPQTHHIETVVALERR